MTAKFKIKYLSYTIAVVYIPEEIITDMCSVFLWMILIKNAKRSVVIYIRGKSD